MPFRTRRQNRYLLLRNSGFLPYEAQTLSKVPLKVPYMDILIKERFKFKKQAIKDGWTKTKYELRIKDEYRVKGWTKKNRLGKLVADPWAMFRANEDVYKSKYPSYNSPWVKRQKSFRDFVSIVEKAVKGHYQTWIAELDQSIAKATGKRKAQLEQQKKNLETWTK